MGNLALVLLSLIPPLPSKWRNEAFYVHEMSPCLPHDILALDIIFSEITGQTSAEMIRPV